MIRVVFRAVRFRYPDRREPEALAVGGEPFAFFELRESPRRQIEIRHAGRFAVVDRHTGHRSDAQAFVQLDTLQDQPEPYHETGQRKCRLFSFKSHPCVCFFTYFYRFTVRSSQTIGTCTR